jgi:FkbM family methyltransferase
MMGRLVKSSLRHFGYDITEYPLPDWYLLREGLSELFACLQINYVIDVGANCGQYGDFLRRIGYRGNIISFEPVTTSFQLLSERSENDNAWHGHNLALGSSNQTLDINIMSSSDFSSILPANSYGSSQFAKATTVVNTERVQVVRLDSMIDEITKGIKEPHIYLKMDTQGYDLQVLEGASGCLPLVLGLQSEIALKTICEGMPDYLTSLATLNALGFSSTSFIPVTRDEELRVVEFDCLMVRNSQS